MKKTYYSLLTVLCLIGTVPSMAQCNLVSTTVVGQPTCGMSNGTVHINVSGGQIPYTYYFNSAQVAGPDLSDVSAGAYTYWVHDAVYCWFKGDVVITCHEDCHFKTFTQGGWGAVPNGGNPGVYMTAHFASAFPNGLTIGCNRILRLTNAQAVTDFLPSGSTPKKLLNNLYLNPGGSYNNVLAGQLVAATLSVTFDAVDPTFAPSGGALGNGVISSGTFAGWTVSSLLAAANQFIGNCSSSYTASQFNEALTALNENFDNGISDNGFVICTKAGENRSLQSAEAGIDLGVFPNPASDMFTVNVQLPAAGEGTIVLYDITGRIAMQQNFSSEDSAVRSIPVNVSMLNAGTYTVSVAYNNTLRTSRLVLAR